MLNIPIILGTARKGRQSEKVAKYILQKAKDFGFKSNIIDPRKYNLTASDNSSKSSKRLEFVKKVIEADGFIIVSPEYNHSFPGELKMLMDQAYIEYSHKAVGLCGVSNGPWGGTRAIEQLRTYTVNLHLSPTGDPLMFPNVQDLFDEKGSIKDSSYNSKVQRFLTSLSWLAHALKSAREIK